MQWCWARNKFGCKKIAVNLYATPLTLEIDVGYAVCSSSDSRHRFVARIGFCNCLAACAHLSQFNLLGFANEMLVKL